MWQWMIQKFLLIRKWLRCLILLIRKWLLFHQLAAVLWIVNALKYWCSFLGFLLYSMSIFSILHAELWQANSKSGRENYIWYWVQKMVVSIHKIAMYSKIHISYNFPISGKLWSLSTLFGSRRYWYHTFYCTKLIRLVYYIN